jgi:hypothetical protein
MTALLEIPDMTLEDLAALHPRATCVPRLGTERILPKRSTPTSGLMEWRWSAVPHPLILDNALIQIGDRTWTARDPHDPIIRLAPRTPLVLRARLNDFR